MTILPRSLMQSSLIALMVIFSLPAYGLTVCLDLGNLVFYSNTGMPEWLVKRIKSNTYRFLEHARPYRPDEVHAYDDQGLRLPQPMCDWQKGTATTAEIKKDIIDALHADTTYFTLAVQRKLTLYVINRIFTPHKVVDTQILNEEVKVLVNYCKEKGYDIIIASNFPHEEFELLRKKHAAFFDCCKGFHISGRAHTMKPDQLFFEQITHQYNLEPHDCILFDDRPENRKAARKLGWHAFYKTKTTYGITGPHKKTDFHACVDFIKKIELQQTPTFSA